MPDATTHTTTDSTSDDSLLLAGLDAGNPLGFLAALGTLALAGRLANDAPPRLSWEPSANGYRPRLLLSPAASPDEFADALHARLAADFADGPPDYCRADLIKRPAGEYRAFADGAARSATAGDRASADFAAAFASDAADDDSGLVAPTAISFANGQSGKVLLRDYRDLARGLRPAHLRDALFRPWAYRDPCKTFRWDPADRRAYALRASDPGNKSLSPVLAVHGANVLGFWGLSLLPSVPRDGGLMTTGFARVRPDPDEPRTVECFTWPVWECPASADVARGLLGSGHLRADRPDAVALRAAGVACVYRSNKLKIGAPPFTSFYFSAAAAV